MAGIVLITAQERPRLGAFRTNGFHAFLVRPLRRKSLLALLRRQFTRDARVGLQPQSSAPAAADDGAPEPFRILLAEDNAVNALMARSMITKAGSICVVAQNGREAVQAVASTLRGQQPPFDLILMDIHMPECDGLTAAREIRQLAGDSLGSANGRCPPIVALTASAFAADRERCFEAGMKDYLSKPFSWPELEALLVRWLPQRTEQRRAGAA